MQSRLKNRRKQLEDRKQSCTMVKFDPTLIAPCGLNCGTCMGYLRQKNHCPGCRHITETRYKSINQCIIRNCAELEKTSSDFCHGCGKFPCARMKQLDKRYRTKYRTSPIENLHMIRENIESFLNFEASRRICSKCGAVICVHRTVCLTCKASVV